MTRLSAVERLSCTWAREQEPGPAKRPRHRRSFEWRLDRPSALLGHDHELLEPAVRPRLDIGNERQLFAAGIMDRVVAVDEPATQPRRTVEGDRRGRTARCQAGAVIAEHGRVEIAVEV